MAYFAIEGYAEAQTPASQDIRIRDLAQSSGAIQKAPALTAGALLLTIYAYYERW